MPEDFPIAMQITKGDRTLASDAPALTMIPADEGPMDRTRRSNRWFFSGELAVSLLLHTLVAAALIGGVIRQFDKPHVDPINVELVAPPELKKPEPEEKKPEEKQQETPEAEAPPPPPPPPSPQSEEKPVEPQPTPKVMQPVVEFGDTDSGPRKALDGTAAEDAVKSDQPEEKPADPVQAEEDAGEPKDAEAAGAEPAETPPAETADTQEPPKPDQTQPEEVQPEQPLQEQAQPDQPPEPAVAEAPAPEATAETEAPTEDFGTVGPIVTSALPAPKPAQRPAARPASNSAANPAGGSGNSGRQSPRLAEARQLFSDSILGGTRARTAMAGMPQGQRLNLLCMTELRAQLSDWDPARPPEMLPSFRPSGGNVLEPGQAAYGSRGDWYDLNFRCETDKEVTRVVKFSFRIGPPIPPSKWQARGLPSF